jgi:hypothetical protein
LRERSLSSRNFSLLLSLLLLLSLPIEPERPLEEPKSPLLLPRLLLLSSSRTSRPLPVLLPMLVIGSSFRSLSRFSMQPPPLLLIAMKMPKSA